MTTLKELRIEARLTHSALARLANMDRQTLVRAEKGTAVRCLTAYAIVDALTSKLGRAIKLEEITDLNVL